MDGSEAAGRVRYERQDAVVYITLDRPSKRNALTESMHAELVAAFQEFDADPEARVGVLRGEGLSFCAGRDITYQVESAKSPTAHLDVDVINQYGLPPTRKLTVASARGHAYGAGGYYLLGCDVRVVTKDLVFALREVPTGVLGPYWLQISEQIPRQLAFRLAVVGEVFRASELENVLFSEVVDDSQLEMATQHWVETLLALPPEHASATKQLMSTVAPFAFTADVAAEECKVRGYLDSLPDTAEAAQAFVERRPPLFTGRPHSPSSA
jgi:enoyl-CoA hydratase/carnithine racemase